MDSDDGLMLNITGNTSDEFTAVSPNKRGRNKWKERKQQRRNNNVNSESATFNFKREENTSTKQEWVNSNTTVKDKETKEHKHYSKQQVISSLFRHNPEIPKVERSVESPKNNDDSEKERPLFSGEKFSDLPLSPHMISNLEQNLQMTTLTSVQKSAIPTLIEGKDIFIKSKTGSGKTLCYAVPIVHSLQKLRPKIERCDGPYALVLVPTRELALQSFNLLLKLVKPFQWVVPGYVIGGEKRKSEKARLRKGVNILVATPGRLLDHIEKTKCLEFGRVGWIVLDEADRLLDMGFEKDVSAILQSIRNSLSNSAKFQTVLMSATLNKGVEKLVQVFLKDPQFVDERGVQDALKEEGVGKPATTEEDSIQNTPQQLKQFFVIVPSKMRLVTLAAFILSKHNGSQPCKSIVFLSSRDSVDFHHTLFREILCKAQELKLFKLHGNMSQIERTDVFKRYSSCLGGVLLSTDVAARGLDLPNVNWIIQYNTPGSAVDYIHRVGRTARIGTEGQALLFLTPSEIAYLEILAEHNIRPEEVIVSDVLRTLISSNKNVDRRKTKKPELLDHLSQEAATSYQTKFEEFVMSKADNMRAAKNAYQSFVRSYATFSASLKHIFHVKNLHLGHVAKAFALRDAPTGMFGQSKEKGKKNKSKQTKRNALGFSRKRGIPVDEHISDSFRGPRPKKKKIKR